VKNVFVFYLINNFLYFTTKNVIKMGIPQPLRILLVKIMVVEISRNINDCKKWHPAFNLVLVLSAIFLKFNLQPFLKLHICFYYIYPLLYNFLLDLLPTF